MNGLILDVKFLSLSLSSIDYMSVDIIRQNNNSILADKAFNSYLSRSDFILQSPNFSLACGNIQETAKC